METAAYHKSIGDGFFKNKQYQEAVHAYSRAISLASSEDTILSSLYSNRCASYLYLNKLPEAHDDATSCTQYNPNWAKGFSRLGNCLLRMNRYQESVNAFKRAKLLDPNNAEITKSLNEAQNRLNGRSFNPSSSSSSSAFNQSISSIKDQIMKKGTELMMKAVSWWTSLTQQQKTYTILGLVGIVVYYLFFRSNSSYYTPSYGSSYGYGSGGSGLSWTMWGAIMYGAYKIPPYFPDLLGPYARPFFGMNFTTFMWLVDMFSRNRGNVFGRRRGFY